ncbi:glycosyltransferase family 2 protein [Desulfotomaculum copahuensis]|uniref:Bactoprenol glucosyl transferase n=1 Tax=Desulfotomaculum copahuensis TaxID=1838280 RepID=A0A1B7LBI5_9FIRM|nr:glycosyltransferase family 2 protein [Desulfotomaculum copahuensis]OAT79902.1 bactoprenol glucosyl transferase [Desulfotomaculum copahuensis]
MYHLISVVCPMYNEMDNITAFYERTVKVLTDTGQPFELICINDGSCDRTLDRLIALNQRDNRVKVIDLSRNYGKEIAMSAGIDYSRGEAVILIDADLQHPPEMIPALVEKWREGYDVVYATRSGQNGEPWLKRWTSHIFYKVINKLTSFDVPGDTGDFRLLDRKVVDALRQLHEQHRFMKGLFSWVGFRQTGVTYNQEPRHAGKSKWNYWQLCNLAIEGITSFSYTPLRFATFFGLVVAFLSIVYGIYLIIDTLLHGNPVPGYPSLMVMILFLGGVQLFTIGIIGEYIGRTYIETKKRPLYFVRSTRGFDTAAPVEMKCGSGRSEDAQ